jgi:hypothetical protein
MGSPCRWLRNNSAKTFPRQRRIIGVVFYAVPIVSKENRRLRWGSWPDIHYSLTVTVLCLCGVLSDERTGLSFLYAAGLRQRSLSRVRVPWDSWPYFTALDLKLTISSPPTTRRVTVEVFVPASTRVSLFGSQSQSQSQSYFTTGGLPPISLSWRQAPWDSRPESRYIASAPTAQITHFHCWLAPTAGKTSHVVPVVASGITRRGQVTWLPLSEFIGALTVA